MTAIVFLYGTAPNDEIAAKIGDTLVRERLAACVNILAPARSIYEWEGKIETANEVPFLVKTTRARASAARDRILALHPFDCPCIAAFPISDEGSSVAFLDWVTQATTSTMLG